MSQQDLEQIISTYVSNNTSKLTNDDIINKLLDLVKSKNGNLTKKDIIDQFNKCFPDGKYSVIKKPLTEADKESVNLCDEPMKSGKRKDTPCGRLCMDGGDKCKMHSKRS